MTKRFWSIVMVVVTLALASLACEFSASTASIQSAKLTADPKGGSATTTFASNQAFYYVVEMSNAPDSTKVKAVWSFIDNGNAQQFVEKEIVGSGSPITFSATNANPWPAGKYKVELYLDDKLNRTDEFSVK